VTVRIINAHVLDGLAMLPDASVHTVVTSPPYFRLRAYGTEPQVWGGDPGCEHDFEDRNISFERGNKRKPPDDGIAGRDRSTDKAAPVTVTARNGFCRHCNAWRGELGLEPTPELYIEHLVVVFGAVRRVLRDAGPLWIVIGDSYANHGKWGGHTGGKHAASLHASPIGRNKRYTGLKPKDLIGIPWMLAFALRADGWWLRKDIIWAKPNPMPETCADRCTTAHEYLFHLTKSAKYFYDAEAIKEKAAWTDPDNDTGAHRQQRLTSTADQPKGALRIASGSGARNGPQGGVSPSRNKRSVWTIATAPFAEAHFATFPAKLVEPCILAGTSASGVCPACGAPWVRVVKSIKLGRVYERGACPADHRGVGTPQHTGSGSGALNVATETLGWRASCDCNAGDPAPATVLDPFGGSGTMALVADRLGRDAILIELNPAYAEMARHRIQQDAPLMTQVEMTP